MDCNTSQSSSTTNASYYSNYTMSASCHSKQKKSKTVSTRVFTKWCSRLFKKRDQDSDKSSYKNLSMMTEFDYPFSSAEFGDMSCNDSMASDWDLYTTRDAFDLTTDLDITVTEPRTSTPTGELSITSADISMVTNNHSRKTSKDLSKNKYKHRSKEISRKMKHFKLSYKVTTLAVL